jgi:ADP-heptose:LPS heptosyltransferase
MASVTAQALAQRYTHIEALTLPAHREALEHVPEFQTVFTDTGEQQADLAAQLEARRYDACIVTWATSRTARVAQQARIPVRVGQSRRLYSWRFTHPVAVRSELGDVTSHWSQIMLDYARALGCQVAHAVPHFVPAHEDRVQARRLIESIGVAQGYVLLHPTNAIASKRGIWPVEGWAALARELRRRFELPVLLTGSPADGPINAAIVQHGGDTQIVDIAGQTSMGEFGALAQSARLFVGITTGSMHVAAAVGAPTVGIFPFQTDTPERWAPLGGRTAVVRASYPCRPGERKETCPDYACIAHLDVARIVAACAALLSVR